MLRPARQRSCLRALRSQCKGVGGSHPPTAVRGREGAEHRGPLEDGQVGPDQGDSQSALSRVKTILAGYDGTRSAQHALSRAAVLARAFDSKVVVVSVAAPKPLTAPGAFG